jgi:1-phosphatidylinositol-3-phosphate 5-kinase
MLLLFPSVDSLVDSESEDEIELQDTGQLNSDSIFTDGFMEQRKGSLIQVDEIQLRHGAVVDDGASFHVPGDENISYGQQGLQTHGHITKEDLDATNIILDSNVSSQPHEDDLCNDQLMETKNGLSVEGSCPEQSDVLNIEEVTSLPMPSGEIIPLNGQVTELDSVKENTIVYNNLFNTERDMRPSPDIDNENECMFPLAVPSFDLGSLIWLPPEPANKEDDIDTDFNNDDGSDENSTEWGRPSFIVSFTERSKESREVQLQKVMSEVMNGQFKFLVSRFLAAEGFSLSDRDTDKGWLDIVASLSWAAALLVKPDANSGNAMDPGLYVKVKCIASGSRQQR